jgi:hypothetical protein
MRRVLPYLAVVALAVPGSGASAQGDGWWGTVTDRVATSQERLPDVCRIRPDLEVCRTGRYPDRRGDTRRDDDGGWYGQDRDGRSQARNGRRGNGPPFCRNGQGHPTKGRQWCRDKGWTNSSGWYDAGWEDVILGRPRTRRSTLDRGGLIDVLGDVVLGRLQRQAGGSPLVGRLIGTDRRILQVRAGNRPLAELLDANGDGRTDRILLFRSR